MAARGFGIKSPFAYIIAIPAAIARRRLNSPFNAERGEVEHRADDGDGLDVV